MLEEVAAGVAEASPMAVPVLPVITGVHDLVAVHDWLRVCVELGDSVDDAVTVPVLVTDAVALAEGESVMDAVNEADADRRLGVEDSV